MVELYGKTAQRGDREVKFVFASFRSLEASDKARVVQQPGLKTTSGDTLEDYLKDIPQFVLPLKLKEKTQRQAC